MSNLSEQLQRQLLSGGVRFERYNGDSDQLWYSPITNQLLTVPAALDETGYVTALRSAGLRK